jgi:hypothetical protein
MPDKSTMLKLIPFIFDHYLPKSFNPFPAFSAGEMCINAVQRKVFDLHVLAFATNEPWPVMLSGYR